jgi:hypothetical protein
MPQVIICNCPEKPKVNTDSPLVEAIVKFGYDRGFDTSRREGNAVKVGNTWYVAYYDEDLEKVEDS